MKGKRGRPPLPKTIALKARIIEMEAWKNPKAIKQIAAEFGVHFQAIYKLLKAHPEWYDKLDWTPSWSTARKVPHKKAMPMPEPTFEDMPDGPPDPPTEAPEATSGAIVATLEATEANLAFFIQVRDNPRAGWGDRLKAAQMAYKIQSGLEDEHWRPPSDNPDLWAEAVRDAILELPKDDQARVANLLRPKGN